MAWPDWPRFFPLFHDYPSCKNSTFINGDSWNHHIWTDKTSKLHQFLHEVLEYDIANNSPTYMHKNIQLLISIFHFVLEGSNL